MKERTLAIIITVILLIIGLIIGSISGLFASAIYSSLSGGSQSSAYTDFNFYRSDLDINGTNIKETLYFLTDKEYHTLFRDFESIITTKDNTDIKNSIAIVSVDCTSGTPYFRINTNCYEKPDFTTPKSCKEYTENNEIGCTFGNVYGFNNNQEYKITSEQILNPENLFKINGAYYIKYIAYGRNNHVDLLKNQNLFITGDYISIDSYKSSEYVIIYIPHTGSTNNYNILEKPDFEYDLSVKKNPPSMLLIILIFIVILFLHLLPAILFYCSYHFFGKELIDEDMVPEQRSDYPNKRKPWEVAAFFNPPFGQINQNFFSAMLLDFYRRKIVDLKLTKGFFKDELLIKINKNLKDSLDKVEQEFMNILLHIEENAKESNKQEDYFNINKASKQYISQIGLRVHYIEFKEILDKETKKYIERTGIIFFILTMIPMIILSIIFFQMGLMFLSIISLVIISIISVRSSLLLKFKGDFYKEYLEWQAFKKWLKGSPSMKEHGHRGVVLWEEYLVYATALGVSKQVLKELKQEGLINDKQFNTYTGIHTATMSFAASGAGAGSGHGGGFSGGGGGGVGGGGGGGR